MTGATDITQLCFSSNLAGIVANKIEQSFYSVYSYSGIESIERALKMYSFTQTLFTPKYHFIYPNITDFTEDGAEGTK